MSRCLRDVAEAGTDNRYRCYSSAISKEDQIARESRYAHLAGLRRAARPESETSAGTDELSWRAKQFGAEADFDSVMGRKHSADARCNTESKTRSDAKLGRLDGEPRLC